MTLENKLEQYLETNHIFLTGGGGVGKSYLCQKLIEKYKNENKNLVVLGSTGISAVGIGGQTLHSFFALGICNDLESLIQQDKKNKSRIKELNSILEQTELIIIDEVSMIAANVMDMIKYRLDHADFQGKLLFVGDFFQLPPVFKTKKIGLFEPEIFAFESSAWTLFNPKTLELTKTKRTKDLEFFQILSQIRKGTIDDIILEYLNNLRKNNLANPDDATVLFGTNKEAFLENQRRLQKLDNPLIKIKAKESLQTKISQNKLEKWKQNLPVFETLELKIGAKVLFCVNKWGKFFNGEQGIVREINDDFIKVEKENGIVNVERHEFKLSEFVLLNGEVEEKVLASFNQFPLKLAYAITIHKSQGMSIENLICNLNNIFEKGQLYVALSRAKNPKNLRIDYFGNDFENKIRSFLKTDEAVKNFHQKTIKINLEEQE